MRRHPNEHDLALFAGGDLGWMGAWRVGRHIGQCDRCAESVEEFRQIRGALNASDPTRDLDWNRLAAEMEANIHLGLEAGECVTEERRPASVPTGWRMLAVYAAVFVMVIGLVWWDRRSAQSVDLAAGAVVFSATDDSIELQQGGRSLGLLHEGVSDVTYTAAANGAVGARYVDAETGNVTIQNVVSSE